MANPQHGATYEDAPAALVRAELNRILTSEIFSRSDRLSAFLKFIVQQTLSGHGHTLKEQVIAIELYGKGSDFNTTADPIVRVDARRLRDHLREYYASAPQDVVIISVPKGSYTPVFQRNGRALLPVADAGSASDDPDADHVQPAILAAGERAQSARKSRGVQWIAIGAIVIVLGLVVAILRTRGGRQDYSPVGLLTVTSLPGSEEDPSLSPDGSFVAFSWTGPGPGLNSDIWIKAVDGDEMRQLTTTSDAFEKYPMWTPDGQHISFTRFERGASRIFIVSPLGGPERMIAEPRDAAAWLPDGRSLVMLVRTSTGAALVHYVVATGARRQLFEAPAGFALGHPRVSPDGRSVAFQTYGQSRSAVLIVSMNGGPATPIGPWESGNIGGLGWTPDGREILFARPELSGRRLVRVVVGGTGPAVPIPAAPHGSVNPSASRPRAGERYRLAFSSGQPDVGLRMIDLEGSRRDRTITAVVPFCDATRMDTAGRFSRDGSKVAFVSDRGGSQQVWVAGRDGTELRTVTSLQDATMSVGSWSPDGQWIAFDATVAGNSDIYVVRADGGSIKRLTRGAAAEIDPEWSHDARWLYFSSNASGTSAIWKLPASGGTPVRLSSDVASIHANRPTAGASISSIGSDCLAWVPRACSSKSRRKAAPPLK